MNSKIRENLWCLFRENYKRKTFSKMVFLSGPMGVPNIKSENVIRPAVLDNILGFICFSMSPHWPISELHSKLSISKYSMIWDGFISEVNGWNSETTSRYNKYAAVDKINDIILNLGGAIFRHSVTKPPFAKLNHSTRGLKSDDWGGKRNPSITNLSQERNPSSLDKSQCLIIF